MRYFLSLFVLAASISYSPQVQAQTAQAVTWDDAVIEDISADQSSLRVRYAGQKFTLAVKALEIKAALKSFGKGDRVNLSSAEEAGQNILQSISVKTDAVNKATRIAALLISGVGLLLFFLLLLPKRLADLIKGEDNRYSNSKFQVVLWFFILIAVYITITFFRLRYGGTNFVTGVNIPQNLLVLSGLSALTFAAAKGITQSKIESKEIVKTTAPKPRFPFDLLHDDQGRVDMADFQMIIVTLLAVVAYLIRVFGFLEFIEFHSLVTLPDVDTTILATFGLGQGAYLVKKYVGEK